MVWISFGRWSSSSGALFIRKRIYWNGTEWTPFVRLFWRYCKSPAEEAVSSLSRETLLPGQEVGRDDRKDGIV